MQALQRPGIGEVARRGRHTGVDVVEPESVRKVRLYAPSVRASSPAAAGFAEFLASWTRNRALGL